MSGAANGWTVYAIDLKKSVLKNRKFLRANRSTVRENHASMSA